MVGMRLMFNYMVHYSCWLYLLFRNIVSIDRHDSFRAFDPCWLFLISFIKRISLDNIAPSRST